MKSDPTAPVATRDSQLARIETLLEDNQRLRTEVGALHRRLGELMLVDRMTAAGQLRSFDEMPTGTMGAET